MLRDAELTDIQFVDPDIGFAVGERGVIWRSDDGGRSWKLQNSGVNCRLEAVHFVDAKAGWAVGGYAHPHTRKTTGVVLQTVDGGVSWRKMPKGMTPALRDVKFLNARNGWAVGAGSSLAPGGLFHTRDGGFSWAPTPGRMKHSWLTADFVHFDQGYAANSSGGLASVSRSHAISEPTPNLGLRSIRDLCVAGETVWAVGDGELILQRTTSGWQSPASHPPTLGGVDYRAVACVENNIWAVGSPGSVIIHSPDGGRTWRTLKTGITTPLNSIHFFDKNHGWAAGALGVILITRDGGEHWTLRKSGGERAAMLACFADATAKDIPWELIAKYSADGGYLTQITLPFRASYEDDNSHEIEASALAQNAFMKAGATDVETQWRFPIPDRRIRFPSSILTTHWSGGSAGLEENLVRSIRMWRPAIVLSDPPHTEDSSRVLLHDSLQKAVKLAADASAYPHHFKLQGLEPWRIKKVYSISSEHLEAHEVVLAASLAPRLRVTYGEFVSEPRALMQRKIGPAPKQVSVRLLQSFVGSAAGQGSIFSGAISSNDQSARRPRSSHQSQNSLAQLRMAQQRRNWKQIIGQGALSSTLLSQFQELTTDMPADDAVAMTRHMAERFLSQGEPSLAAEAHAILVERYPEHPFAESSSLWLLHFLTSAEGAHQRELARRLVSKKQNNSVRPATFMVPDISGAEPPSDVLPADYRFEERSSEEQRGAAPILQDNRARLEKALQLGELIRRSNPNLHADPRVRLPLAAAERQLQLGTPITSLNDLSKGDARNLWIHRAKLENQLLQPSSAQLQSLVESLPATKKPYLDGVLDDPCWEGAPTLNLRSNHSQAEIRIRHDETHLFIAIQATKHEAALYERSRTIRQRDANLEDQDRLILQLDIDRDYTSAYSLAFDHRGWVQDDCSLSPKWNPKMSVAANNDEKTWQVEVAIPWNELCSQPPQGELWAISATRVIPQAEILNWLLPASSNEPGFGLLRFSEKLNR